MKVYLCGPPCAGKSTIAKEIAKRMGWECIDTDSIIEESDATTHEKKHTVSEIYVRDGVESFRKKEQIILHSIRERERCIVALGGGILSLPEKREGDLVVYLKSSMDVLWDRLLQRPQLPAYLSDSSKRQAFEDHVRPRMISYEHMSDIVVDTNKRDYDSLVDKMITMIREYEKVDYAVE